MTAAVVTVAIMHTIVAEALHKSTGNDGYPWVNNGAPQMGELYPWMNNGAPQMGEIHPWENTAYEKQFDRTMRLECPIPKFYNSTTAFGHDCKKAIEGGQLAECYRNLAEQFAWNAAKFGAEMATFGVVPKVVTKVSFFALQKLTDWYYQNDCPGADTSSGCRNMIKECDPVQYEVLYGYNTAATAAFCKFWDFGGMTKLVAYLTANQPEKQCTDNVQEMFEYFRTQRTDNRDKMWIIPDTYLDAVDNWGFLTNIYHGVYMTLSSIVHRSNYCGRLAGLGQPAGYGCSFFQNKYIGEPIKPDFPAPTPAPIVTTITITTTFTYPEIGIWDCSTSNNDDTINPALIECFDDLAKMFFIFAVQRGATDVPGFEGDLYKVVASMPGVQQLWDMIHKFFKGNANIKSVRHCVNFIGTCSARIAEAGISNYFSIDNQEVNLAVANICQSFAGEFLNGQIKRLSCQYLQEVNFEFCNTRLTGYFADMIKSYADPTLPMASIDATLGRWIENKQMVENSTSATLDAVFFGSLAAVCKKAAEKLQNFKIDYDSVFQDCLDGYEEEGVIDNIPVLPPGTGYMIQLR